MSVGATRRLRRPAAIASAERRLAQWVGQGPATPLLRSPWRLGLAAFVMAALWTALRVLVAAHGHIGGLVVAGSDYVSPSPYTRGLPIRPGTGYDGQFYFRLGLGPLDWGRQAFGIRLDSLGRLDRVAYPTVAWALSAGQASLLPWTLVLANLTAFGALAGLCAALAEEAGRHPLWGLLVAGFWGFLWALGRDLTELTEAVFVVAGLLALRRRRPLLAGAMLALAALAREEAMAVVGALVLARAWQAAARRRRPRGHPPASIGGRWPDAAWAVPSAAFIGWQLALRVGTGSFPVRASGNDNSGIPLVGVADGLVNHIEHVASISSLLWLGELGILAFMVAMAACSLRSSTAPLHEKLAWALAVLLSLSLAKNIWMGNVGFRSLDDLYLLSGVLVLSSRIRLDLLGPAATTAWAVVAVELVLFI